MKKRMLVIIMLLFAILLVACSEDASESTEKNETNTGEETTNGQEEETKEVSEEETTIQSDDVEITEEMKEMTYDTIMGYEGVKDAYIEVNGDEITMTLQVGASLNEETRKELGDNFVRNLSSNVSFNYDELESPSKDDYGTLFHLYDLQIGVGTGADDIIQGAKVTSSPKITW
ncbi:hypothetical protein [Thalassobacillus devorans]|uniref:hypothetical protein n=1 Tax=Thalassobacillus devorans TaxID=279813 RepID=UPI00048BDFAA|nr:hypothetical protein [Thalassobacillus devorans]